MDEVIVAHRLTAGSPAGTNPEPSSDPERVCGASTPAELLD